jgi:SAM-dependent methyltransferase
VRTSPAIRSILDFPKAPARESLAAPRTLDGGQNTVTWKRLVPRSLKDELKGVIRSAAQDAAREIPPPAAPAGPIAPGDELAAKVRELTARVADLEASSGQLEAILRHDGTVLPPPKHMQIRVVGGYVPGFIESGFSICDDLNAVLGVVGKSLGDFGRILDWGCGCGRNSRALKTLYPACEVHGADIDTEAIAWLRRAYHGFGDFHVAPHRPPMPFKDGFFDFIFGISVFTHLPEDMQWEWLTELARITKPGGYLIMTTSGEPNYKNLSADMRKVVETKGFLYLDGNYGQSISLPAFYQNTFHSLDYIRREWPKYFEVLDMQQARMQQHQDTILLRRRP